MEAILSDDPCDSNDLANPDILSLIGIRIDGLSNLIANYDEGPTRESEITSQIYIIESLLKFYGVGEISRFENLKSQYYKQNYKIYTSIDEGERLTRINNQINHIANLQNHLKNVSTSQNKFVDNLGLYMYETDATLEMAHTELTKHRDYLKRKNKYIRCMLMFFLMVLIIIGYKIF